MEGSTYPDVLNPQPGIPGVFDGPRRIRRVASPALGVARGQMFSFSVACRGDQPGASACEVIARILDAEGRELLNAPGTVEVGSTGTFEVPFPEGCQDGRVLMRVEATIAQTFPDGAPPRGEAGVPTLNVEVYDRENGRTWASTCCFSVEEFEVRLLMSVRPGDEGRPKG